MFWTPDLDQTLKRLWDAGHSCDRIAELMNNQLGIRISKNSVIGRAHRTDLRPRKGGVESIQQYEERLDAWRLRHGQIKTPTLDAWVKEPHHLPKEGIAKKPPKKPTRAVKASKPVHDRPSKLKTLGDGSEFIYACRNPKLYGL